MSGGNDAGLTDRGGAEVPSNYDLGYEAQAIKDYA